MKRLNLIWPTARSNRDDRDPPLFPRDLLRTFCAGICPGITRLERALDRFERT